jgi:hypothetical protein
MNEKIDVKRWSDSSYSISTIEPGISDDLFISCVGFEPRTIAVLSRLGKNYNAKSGLFLINDEFSKFHKFANYIAYIHDICKKEEFFNTYEIFGLSFDNPIKIIKKIDDIVEKYLPQKLNVTMDITTFPRHELLTTLYYLRHSSLLKRLRILYVTPKKYGNWLSRGYKRFMLLPFFQGPSTFHNKVALLVLTGFEKERAISLIDDLEPSAVFLAMAEPGTAPQFQETSRQTVNRIKELRQIYNEIFFISGNDPFKCRDSLIEIMDRCSPEYDFFVAPIGPKLTVLGLYLAYEKKPNFRIVYPFTQTYNIEHYSSGCRNVYEIILNNAQIDNVIQEIDK